MNPTFAFTNLAYHDFWAFTERSFLNHFFWEYKQRKDGQYQKFVEGDIESFNDSLTNFDNEIQQIINTTNQETIDFYFNYLKELVEPIEQTSPGDLLQHIGKHNSEILKDYEAKVEKLTTEYLSSEDRKKYNHLEEYEVIDFWSLPALGYTKAAKKIKAINYKYYCIDEIPEVLDIQYFNDYKAIYSDLRDKYLVIAYKYLRRYDSGEIKANAEKFFNKTVVYLEGDHDISFIKRAAELLKHTEFLNKVELRQRGGYRNLDKIWEFYKEHSLEVVPQKKILLYDCDTNKTDEEFGGYLFKRIIPTIPEGRITKGIENLFGTTTVQFAFNHKPEFIDFKNTRTIVRGVEKVTEEHIVNKDEKANFCKWICENGNVKDFKNFEIIFKIIDEILERKLIN